MQNIQNSGNSRSNQLFMNDHSLEEEEEEIKKFEKTLEKCIDDSKSKAKIQPVYSREWLEQLRAMIQMARQSQFQDSTPKQQCI